jgi:hypothetical protein
MNGDADRFYSSRRAFLGAVSGIAALTGVGTVAAADGAVQFEDQTTGGKSIIIGRIETTVDATVRVVGVESREELADINVDSGTYDDYEIELEQYLTERRRLEVKLYPASGGSRFAKGEATVSLREGVTPVDGIEVTEVSADPGAGFEYPYFLYAPAGPSSEVGGPVLVEPNNTGTATNESSEHREKASQLAEGNWNGGSGRHISDQLLVPFVVPAFPRPRGEPVDSTHYTHQLDRKTMRIDGGRLERIDEQLLAMVEDARQRLRDRDYPVEEGLLLNGFSASGNFVTRFTVLHPEEVTSVTAGGVNGMAVLPRDFVKGETLQYHVGIEDIERLTGSAFDAEAYAAVDQFLYMGALDFNDTVDPRDFDRDRMEALEYRVFGPNMQRDRFPYTKWVYEDAGIDGTVFRIYDGVTHNPQPAFSDLVAFHRRALNGGDTTALGGGVEADRSGGAGAPPTADAAVGTASPTAGKAVSLDGSGSFVYDDSLQAHAWTVTADGDTVTTAAGETATVSLPSAGDYRVELRVVDGKGRVATDTAAISVDAGSSDGSESETDSGDSSERTVTGDGSTPMTTPSDATEATQTPGESGPGPGILGALTGIGGAGYLLRRRARSDDESE